MALRRSFKRRRASITSLIDVIFLLLLFFMLTSTFSQFSEIELVKAAEGEGAGDADILVKTLIIESTSVLIDGMATADSDILERLAGQTSAKSLTLAIVPAEGVTTQRMIDVLARLDDLSDVTIRLVEPTR
ncbi:MAG: biopolymer transporter ExbD [Pseudomonadota bacterium]